MYYMIFSIIMNGQNTQNICDIHIIGEATREWLVKVNRKSTGMSVTLAGISHAEYGFHFRRIYPPMIHVLACWSGQGEVLINGKLQKCGAGQAYITPPSQLHEYMAVRGHHWKIAWVHIYSNDGSINPKQPVLVDIDSEALREIISGMHRESISNCDPTIMDGWYTILHQQCMRLLRGGGIDIRLRKLWYVVDANLEQMWTLEKMAGIAELSEEHLRRLCVSQYGLSPIRYLTKMRMQRAAAMLRATKLKVEQIAYMVGYNNPLAFSTAFRKCMKYTPSSFRML